MTITREEIKRMLDLMPGNHIAYQLDENQHNLVYYTAGIPELSGYSQTDFATIPDPFNLILEEDRIVIGKRLNEGIANHAMSKLELMFRLTHLERGFVWVHMTISQIGILEGKPVLVGSIIDVTKEMVGSDAIMESSDRCICVIEKATKRFLYANTLFYDLIDSTPAEAMGKYCYELLCKTMTMRDNDNCLCYSSINADSPIETYNEEKNKYLAMTGRELVWGEYDAYVFFLSDITREKEMDDLLADSQRRFEVALANSDLMVWEYDMVGNRCINSEKAGKDYNIPLVIENYPESLYETGHVPPETIEQIKDVKRRLHAGETDFSVERRTIRNDGGSDWQKVSYSLECDENGKPIRAIVCGLDISKEKELEAKYEEQMAYLNNLARSAMFSVRLDLDTGVIRDYTCNEPELEPLVESETDADQFLRNFFSTSRFTPASGLRQDMFTQEALKETYDLGRSQIQTTYECSMLNKYLELDLAIYQNPGNQHLEVFYVLNDVTENALMHTAFQHLVDQDYDFVAVITVSTGQPIMLAEAIGIKIPPEASYDEMIFRYANSHRDAYYTEEDFLAVTDEMRLEKIIQKLSSQSVYEFNCRTKGAGDVIDTYRLSFSYSDSTKTRILYTRTNITALVAEEQAHHKALEEALLTAKRADAAKTDFLSRMSHDMRTPMNGIIGMTTLTQGINDLPTEAQNNLDAIAESSNYLLRLINDTLDMSKIESNTFSLNPDTVHAGKLIEHVIQTVTPLVKAKNINLKFTNKGEPLEYIRADRIRIQQLLINIISNAVKFTPSGGRINLDVTNTSQGESMVHSVISVTDTGCGMSETFLEHIFEPFSQEESQLHDNQEGTGLGMAIVKNLVDLMGGTVEVTSAVDRGTTVTISMDLQQVYGVVDEGKTLENNGNTSLEGLHILLAEDHPLNATIAKRLLEKRGISIEHAINGAEAVKAFESTTPGYFDLVLMDIRMPVMDGLAAARAIRASDREDAKVVPIVAMTANAYDEDVRQSQEAGMDAHLSKPVNTELLYATIGELTKRDQREQ